MSEEQSWIPWPGGACPVDEDVNVQYRERNRCIGRGVAGSRSWAHNGSARDIVEYRVIPSAPTLAEIAALRADLAARDAEIARLEDEAQEHEALRDRMSKLLTGTVNALRGEPPPLTLHSWHDLPELATALCAELAQAHELLIEARDKVEWIGCSEEGYDETIRMRDAFISKLDAAIKEK